MQQFKNLICYGLGAATVITIIMLTSYTRPDSSGKETTTIPTNQETTEAAPKPSHSAQEVYAPEVPESVDFAGEALPMDNFDAKERFDRELISNCFRHSATFLFFKKANRYFPIIEPILKENGVPDDMKYLSVAESALSNAVSPAGARGFWQFMSGSAKERNLEVNSEVDERYHLEKATVAACKYLKEAYKDLGNWTLAAASYNMGKAGLKKRMREQGGTTYFDLHLNSETSRYVSRIMAIKEIMENPTRYGFHLEQKDLYPPMPKFKTVTVKGSVPSFPEFAKEHKTTYRMLKLYNPWLRRTSLTNKYNKTYQIRIPTEE
jgi:hypothetical protein